MNKGCLSDIPVGCGSERNENLHKCMKNAASKGRIGVLLALALFSSFLYKWNEKQKMRSKKTKDKVAIPISARKAELLNCSSGLTKEKFGIGISFAEEDVGFLLPAAYEHCSNTLGEMQDIMELTFHDKDDSTVSTDEGEDDICTLKDIESEAFSIALNLFFLTNHLPEVVSSEVNTSHFHLMASNALFCFGTMLSKDTAGTSTELEELLRSYRFAKVQVAPDGDCLFASIIFQLNQMLSAGNSDLAKHLQVLGFNIRELRDDKAAIAALRALMVAEMVENRVEYEGYLTNESVEYEDQVKEFQKLGVYSGEVGNFMALSLSNVLRINIVLLTSMVNFPVIPITPRKNVCTDETM